MSNPREGGRYVKNFEGDEPVLVERTNWTPDKGAVQEPAPEPEFESPEFNSADEDE